MQRKAQKNKQLFEITGSILKSLREQQGKSLNLFSYENDLQKSMVSRLENGKNEPKLLSLWRISEALDIKMSEIFKYIEDELPKDWKLEEK
ncbi:MAG: helix-turn-helix transcriptional regulator [Candidatus Gastranaerophilaceae bacterium]|jgi:transcriptional regulator with XRE-family HTH domain